MGEFDSAWLKWGRAVVHAQALEAEIHGVVPESQAFGTIRNEYQPKRHGFAVIVDHAEPLPPGWRLILGDCANDFRCSLDHIAWALVKRGNQPTVMQTRKASGIYFPITKNRTDFNSVVPGKLPGLRRADLTLVRNAQPWHRGITRVQWHCLSLLDGIVRTDKHREMQGLWMIPELRGFRLIEAKDCEPSDRGRGLRRFMEVDAEIGFIRARKAGPNPELRLEYELTVYPAFHPQLQLHQWLDQTTVQVLLILRELGEPPEALMDLGLDFEGVSAAVATWMTSSALWDAVKGRGIARTPNPTD